MSKMTLIRGLPGTGKTTKARTLEGFLFAADDYFGSESTYVFDPKELSNAHLWCKLSARSHARMGCNVVVHNTFTCRWEMDPYVQIAKEFDMELVVIDLFDAGLSDEALGERNSHGVPVEAITAMRARYEHDWESGDVRPPWLRK